MLIEQICEHRSARLDLTHTLAELNLLKPKFMSAPSHSSHGPVSSDSFLPTLCPGWKAAERNPRVNVTDESTQRKAALHNNTGGLSSFYPMGHAWTAWVHCRPGTRGSVRTAVVTWQCSCHMHTSQKEPTQMQILGCHSALGSTRTVTHIQWAYLEN